LRAGVFRAGEHQAATPQVTPPAFARPRASYSHLPYLSALTCGGGLAVRAVSYSPKIKRRGSMTRLWMALPLLLALGAAAPAQETRTRDHTVTVISTVPLIAGKKSSLYVRERALPTVLKKGAGDKVVLFVHGAGTPAE